MEDALLTVAYLAAAILFILSLRGLSSQETARKGNTYGVLGMAVAIVATLTTRATTSSTSSRSHLPSDNFVSRSLSRMV